MIIRNRISSFPRRKVYSALPLSVPPPQGFDFHSHTTILGLPTALDTPIEQVTVLQTMRTELTQANTQISMLQNIISQLDQNNNSVPDSQESAPDLVSLFNMGLL